MMLTFELSGRCQGCGQEVQGWQCAFTKRINLGSFVTDSSIAWFRPCGCDRNQPHQPMEVLETRITEESKAAVEAAREKIRARRKRKVA